MNRPGVGICIRFVYPVSSTEKGTRGVTFLNTPCTIAHVLSIEVHGETPFKK